MTLFLLLLACAGPQKNADPTEGSAPPELSAPGSTGPATEPSEPLAPGSPTPGSAPVAGIPEGQPGDVEPGTALPGATPVTPGARAQSLYDECHDRVEGQQAPGECASDADCARAGCSQEVCVPRAAAGDVMTTCEVLPCFAVLDACGCHEGVCSWTVKASAPTPMPRPIPAQ